MLEKANTIPIPKRKILLKQLLQNKLLLIQHLQEYLPKPLCMQALPVAPYLQTEERRPISREKEEQAVRNGQGPPKQSFTQETDLLIRERGNARRQMET